MDEMDCSQRKSALVTNQKIDLGMCMKDGRIGEQKGRKLSKLPQLKLRHRYRRYKEPEFAYPVNITCSAL